MSSQRQRKEGAPCSSGFSAQCRADVVCESLIILLATFISSMLSFVVTFPNQVIMENVKATSIKWVSNIIHLKKSHHLFIHIKTLQPLKTVQALMVLVHCLHIGVFNNHPEACIFFQQFNICNINAGFRRSERWLSKINNFVLIFLCVQA